MVDKLEEDALLAATEVYENAYKSMPPVAFGSRDARNVLVPAIRDAIIQHSQTVAAELAEAKLDLSELARVVGVAFVASTLQPGETLSDPPSHMIVNTVVKLVTRCHEARAQLDRAREMLRGVETLGEEPEAPLEKDWVIWKARAIMACRIGQSVLSAIREEPAMSFMNNHSRFKPIHVEATPDHYFSVAALMLNEQGEILAVSRKYNHADLGIPGGKIDAGETPEEAVRRELLEETGVEARCVLPVFERDCQGQRAITYLITEWEGEPRAVEEGWVGWVPLARLLDPNCSFRGYNGAMYEAVGLTPLTVPPTT